jgi:hypothetical protein
MNAFLTHLGENIKVNSDGEVRAVAALVPHVEKAHLRLLLAIDH